MRVLFLQTNVSKIARTSHEPHTVLFHYIIHAVLPDIQRRTKQSFLPDFQDDLAVMARQPRVEGKTLNIRIPIDHDAVRSFGETLHKASHEKNSGIPRRRRTFSCPRRVFHCLKAPRTTRRLSRSFDLRRPALFDTQS
jgi:hypothetical protein